MDGLRGLFGYMETNKPYFAMVVIQFISAGMSLLSKAAIATGMNPYVFVVYRQAFAAIALAPFALFVERGDKSPPLPFSLLCKIVLSATAMTFVLAVCLRMESLSINQRHGVAKVIGSALGFAGALVCTFLQGPAMYAESRKDILRGYKESYSKSGWIKGSLIILAGNAAWCMWFIMQGPLINQYPAKLRLTALQCLSSCVLSAIWAAAKERNREAWSLGWNFNLLSVFYCGVISTAICYWLLVWVVEKKGPVFGAVFSPLALIITAIFSAILFQETLHWGSVSGAILLVIGLYCILWGKSNEVKMAATNLEGDDGSGRKPTEETELEEQRR